MALGRIADALRGAFGSTGEANTLSADNDQYVLKVSPVEIDQRS